MNHIDLPTELLQFTKTIDAKSLSKDLGGHDWCKITINEFLTNDGIEWFQKKKIFLIDAKVFLFKIVKNLEGPIHIDTDGVSTAGYAFNFVISGQGEMQWVDNIQATQYIATPNNYRYTRFKDIQSFDITDIWTGNLGLVRIDRPHRVVSGNEERYCISIRPILSTNPKTFDDAAKLIYN